jgi:hypothetical protein
MRKREVPSSNLSGGKSLVYLSFILSLSLI